MAAATENRKQFPWAAVFGLSSAALFAACTAASIDRFPARLSPGEMFVSILGMTKLNPEGAAFFNAGMVLCGAFGIPFFLALYPVLAPIGRRRFLAAGVLMGIVNSLSVAMTGVFPEDVNLEVHLYWSYSIFLSVIPMLIVVNAIFRKAGGFSRFIGGFGFLACAVNAVFVGLVIRDGLQPGLCSVMEWGAVSGYVLWIAIVSADVARRYIPNPSSLTPLPVDAGRGDQLRTSLLPTPALAKRGLVGRRVGDEGGHCSRI